MEPGHNRRQDRERYRRIRILKVIDVYSRYAFPPLVDISITREKAAEHLERLISMHGPPKIILRDNGSEFRSGDFGRVIKKYRIEEAVILPVKLF